MDIHTMTQKYRCANCGMIVEMAYGWWPSGDMGGTCPSTQTEHDWTPDE